MTETNVLLTDPLPEFIDVRILAVENKHVDISRGGSLALLALLRYLVASWGPVMHSPEFEDLRIVRMEPDTKVISVVAPL